MISVTKERLPFWDSPCLATIACAGGVAAVRACVFCAMLIFVVAMVVLLLNHAHFLAHATHHAIAMFSVFHSFPLDKKFVWNRLCMSFLPYASIRICDLHHNIRGRNLLGTPCSRILRADSKERDDKCI